MCKNVKAMTGEKNPSTYDSKGIYKYVNCTLFAVIALIRTWFEFSIAAVNDPCVSLWQKLHLLTQFWGLWHAGSWWSPVPHGRPAPRCTAGAAAPARCGAARPQGTCCSLYPLRRVCGQNTQPDVTGITQSMWAASRTVSVTSFLFPGVMEMLGCTSLFWRTEFRENMFKWEEYDFFFFKDPEQNTDTGIEHFLWHLPPLPVYKLTCRLNAC